MKTHSRKCSSVWSAREEDRARALLADRLERERLGVDVEPGAQALEHAQHLEVERELLVRARQAALEPARRVQHEIAAREVRAPERHGRLGRGLRVERVGRGEPAAAPERQAVAPRELAAGERAEHRLRHAERGAAAAHVDAREERAEEAADARADRLRDRDARERLGDLQREPGGDGHRRRRAGEQERRHRDRLVGLGPAPTSRRPSRKSQTSGLLGLTTPMIAGSASMRRAPAVRDRGQLDAVLRARPRRAVGDVRHVRVADPGVVEVEVAARLGHVGGLAWRRSDRSAGSGVACVILTISTWSA